MLVVRTATEAEVSTIVEWARQEGWNPGKHDAKQFYEADRTGFLVGELHGKLVCSVSAVKFGENHAFIGYYICLPEHRGKGFGLQLWKQALECVQGRTLALDAVREQVPTYQKSGFVESFVTDRYSGSVCIPEQEQNPCANMYAIKRIDCVPFANVLRYDSQLVLASREQFLKCWVAQPEAIALAAVSLQTDELVGYCVLRPADVGYRFQPLFADNAAIAEQLVVAALRHIPPESTYSIDVPAENKAAVQLARKFALEPSFACVRMYKGSVPVLDRSRVFGNTSFELG
ncbi:Acetyltransferase, GNAT family protein [Diplonema papillatum]|nr:Acetyltransferase, GNAT family protein [Diplonema papillatum]